LGFVLSFPWVSSSRFFSNLWGLFSGRKEPPPKSLLAGIRDYFFLFLSFISPFLLLDFFFASFRGNPRVSLLGAQNLFSTLFPDTAAPFLSWGSPFVLLSRSRTTSSDPPPWVHQYRPPSFLNGALDFRGAPGGRATVFSFFFPPSTRTSRLCVHVGALCCREAFFPLLFPGEDIYFSFFFPFDGSAG